MTRHCRTDSDVTQRYWLDGEERGEVTRDVADFEDDLSAISLQSGDFTVYWDGFSIRQNSSSPSGTKTNGLSGTVTTPFGDPIEGLKLKLFDRTNSVNTGGNPVATATTNADGEYQFNNSDDLQKVAITAIHSEEGVFDGYLLNLSNPTGEFSPTLHNQTLFGPDLTDPKSAVVSAWRHIYESNSQYQELCIELLPTTPNKFITTSGFGIGFPEEIDVKYNKDMLEDHPASQGVSIFSRAPETEENPIHRFFPTVTGLPAFTLVGTGSNAYQYQPPETHQKGKVAREAAQDILSTLPVIGTIVGTWSAAEKWSGENKVLVAGSAPDEPANPNTTDSVEDIFQRNVDAIVFRVPIQVSDTAGEIRIESRWYQTGVKEIDQQIFGYQ